jgi:hypothetical protein
MNSKISNNNLDCAVGYATWFKFVASVDSPVSRAVVASAIARSHSYLNIGVETLTPVYRAVDANLRTLIKNFIHTNHEKRIVSSFDFLQLARR